MSFLGGGEGDLMGAVEHAASNSDGSGDRGLFSDAVGALQGSGVENQGFDENDAMQSHQSFFGGGGSSGPATSSGMGSAAAVQALKMFTGGGGGSSGGSQNELVGMAMGQASKLFDQQASQGNTHPDATKESAVQEAGGMAMKMYMKSQMENSGGLGSLASKFM